jgi:CubicO group peptidase (beta-lactamase class C family)
MKISLALLGIALACRTTGPVPAQSMADFERRLEALRERYHIVGMGAVIAKDQSIVWSKGFGVAEMGTNKPVTDSTVFHLASLTKPFAATVILQLADEGKVSLDDPASKYGIAFESQGTILVRHLLSHTSEGIPGTRYRYNGDRFGALDAVIAKADGRPTARAIQARIVAPLGLMWTAPNPASQAFAASGKARPPFIANLASGYVWENGAHRPAAYPNYFGAAAGLVGSVRDYAAFSMAIDRDALLKPATKTLSFTPARDSNGQEFPYGLGWFTTTYRGTKVVWHYGYWTANSSLVIKIPDRGLTFVLAANTDGLSSPFPLGAGRLERSDFARAFLDTFLSDKPPLP